jgi:hypothetical protein
MISPVARLAAIAAGALLLCASPARADVERLKRQADRGTVAERTKALKDLVLEDSPAAIARAVSWLEPGQEPALRRAGARALWDFSVAAKSAEPALRGYLDDPDPDVAYNVVGALAALKVPKQELRPARLRLARANDPFIAFYATRALHPDPDVPLAQVIEAANGALGLVAAGRPSDSRNRDTLRGNARELLFVVAREGGRPGFDALLAAYGNAPPPVKDSLADALSRVPADAGDPQRLSVLLDSPSVSVRRTGMHAISRYGERALPQLDAMLAGLAVRNEPELRQSTASALATLAGAPSEAGEQAKPGSWRTTVETRIAPALAQAATTDPVRDVRKEAADALQKLGLWAGPSLGTIGEAIAREPDPGVRHALVRACWSARRSSAIPRNVLAQLAASDPDQYVRNEAKSVLAFNER